ncbi:hypothetical protein AB4Y32_09785 [Paraburkholderia phymatum]|uniref:Uncharacterized protein n=1 Tax=Paraburkholderia phymatum TaxID=148447 RepID=A0ACC6TXP7_9BURK
MRDLVHPANADLSVTIIVGLRFYMHGVENEVSCVTKTSIRFAASDGGKSRVFPMRSFRKALDEGVIQVVDSEGNPQTISQIRTLSRLSERQIEEKNLRLRYVKFALSNGPFPFRKKNLLDTIRAVSSEMEREQKELFEDWVSSPDSEGDLELRRTPEPPSRATLARWLKRYIDSGHDPLSLVSDTDRRGPRGGRFSPEIESLIASKIDSEYLTDQRISAVLTHSIIVDEIVANPQSYSATPQIPSDRTIQRRVAEIDPYIKTWLRFGRRQADRKFTPAGISFLASRPMEWVFMDGHVMHVLVIDPSDGDILCRPLLVALLDLCTRSLVGYYISLLPFCATTALEAVKDMLCRDPSVEPGGEAELITPDNGKDLRSSAMVNVLKRTGMHFEPAEAYHPNGKAAMERFFSTVSVQFSHTIPGTTFSSAEDRGDYDSEEHAALTLDSLRPLFKQWVDTVYHVSVHSETGRAPKLHWQELQQQFPIHHYPRKEIDAIARVPYQRVISNGRVEVDYLHWKSHSLASWEQQGDRDVIVLLDDLDLERVCVHRVGDPQGYVFADPCKPMYMKGLSRYEHQEIRSRFKEAGEKDLAKIGEHTLHQARAKLWRDIREAAGAIKKRVKRALLGSKSTQAPVPDDEPTDVSVEEISIVDLATNSVTSGSKELEVSTRVITRYQSFEK